MSAREPVRRSFRSRAAHGDLQQALRERRRHHERDPHPPRAARATEHGEQDERGGEQELPVTGDVHDAHHVDDGGGGHEEQPIAEHGIGAGGAHEHRGERQDHERDTRDDENTVRESQRG